MKSPSLTSICPDVAATATLLPAGYEFRDESFELPAPLALHFGGQIERPRLSFRLAGCAGAPVVVALGGISGGRNVWPIHADEQVWWEDMVGPGKPLNTDRFRVLGMDYLGGGHRSTGPVRGTDFPSVSAYDQAECLAAIMDHLRIEKLHGCVGASYGGMVALALGERHPERVAHAVVISAAHRTHPMSTAWRSVQRAIVRYALTHAEGERGLVLARALAMATYRSAREFEERFPGEAGFKDGRFVFPVEAYLISRGEAYAAQYSPEAFVCLSESIDLHRIQPENIAVPTTVVAVQEDQLVPIGDVRTLRDRLAGTCQLIEINSLYGHDAFLKETAILRDVFAQSLERTL